MKKGIVLFLIVFTCFSAFGQTMNFPDTTAKGNFCVTFPVVSAEGLLWLGEWSDYRDFEDDGGIYLSATEGYMSLGYFIIDGLEVGPYIYVIRESITEYFNFGAFVNYYIDAGFFLPFVGVRGWVYHFYGGEASATIVSGKLGLAFPSIVPKISPYIALQSDFYLFPDTEGLYMVADVELGIKTFF